MGPQTEKGERQGQADGSPRPWIEMENETHQIGGSEKMRKKEAKMGSVDSDP